MLYAGRAGIRLDDAISGIRLGGGVKARRYLEIEGEPQTKRMEVATPEGTLAFEDLGLTRSKFDLENA